MGNLRNDWQETESILKLFGKHSVSAGRTYRAFVEKESIRAGVLISSEADSFAVPVCGRQLGPCAKPVSIKRAMSACWVIAILSKMYY